MCSHTETKTDRDTEKNRAGGRRERWSGHRERNGGILAPQDSQAEKTWALPAPQPGLDPRVTSRPKAKEVVSGLSGEMVQRTAFP